MMGKKLQTIALIISLISLFILSGCSIVDDLKGGDDNTEETLHPVLLNGKWGYINTAGNMVIEPNYDEAREFSGGFAAVRIGTNWGYVSEESKSLTIPISFSIAGDFEGDLAPAQRPGQLYGFINKSGDFSIAPEFDFAGAFSEGLAAVRADGLWGYVSTDGNKVIELAFSDAQSFSEGIAAVETFEGWIYIDKTGSEQINPDFQISAAGKFSDGLAPIQTTEGWGYIDKTGNLTITPSYDQAGIFSQGLAWVMNDNYIGFINKNGKVQIPYQFAEVKSFSENMSAVRLSGDWFFISKSSGKISINDPFENAQSFNNGIARVQIGDDENPKFGYINKAGEYVWYPTR
ncbi:MAG: WG repeat-containing protein [Balneolaceae bacterium]